MLEVRIERFARGEPTSADDRRTRRCAYRATMTVQRQRHQLWLARTPGDRSAERLHERPVAAASRAPVSVYLLAEHLDAALAAGEDLTGVLYLSVGHAAARGRRDRRIPRRPARRHREASAPSSWRCCRACSWAATGRRLVLTEEERFATVARLYVGRHGDLSTRLPNAPTYQRRGLRRRRRPTALYAQPRAHRAGRRGAAPIPRRSPPTRTSSSSGASRSGRCSISSRRFLDTLEAEYELFPRRIRKTGGSSPPSRRL